MMIDPYVVLDLPKTASEADIRQKYLTLVRQFPPDQAPEKFAQVRAAYDALSDPVEQLRRRLFLLDSMEDIDSLIGRAGEESRKKRLPTATLLSLGEN